jgi:hypothetical protein
VDKKNPVKKTQNSVSFVNEKSEEGTNWTVQRQIQINRSFYKGHQWISWDKVQKRVYVPEPRLGEKRYTYNKIKPHVLTLLAKTCKNRVKLEVKPDTNDIQRIQIAKAGIKYLSYQWDVDAMDAKCRRLKLLMFIDGQPTLKVYVDKKQGNDIPLQEEFGDAPAKTGKIVTQVIDQMRIKVDPSAEDPTEIKWAMEEGPIDVDEIMDEFGVEVEPEENITHRNGIDLGMDSTTSNKKYTNHAIVKDYWEKPCTKYPNGRRIVVAGDKELLNKEDDPGEFPYIFFPAIPIPGSGISTGIVTDMTTPQKSYNVKRTAEARILEEMGNPKWLIPNASVEDEDELHDDIGIVHHNPVNGSEPKRVEGVEPGNGWQAAMERDEADMEDISGAHEISQGGTPKGQNTLGGLQLQLEQDETKLSLVVQSYEDGMKLWGEKVLRLVQKHFPEEQQLSIVGENGEIDAFVFSGADLTGKEVVDVVPGSSMPTLKAIQDEKVMAMYSAGMFTDPRTGMPDTRKVVRMLGESIATQYFDDTEQDENKALMENRTWQQAFADEQTAMALMQYMMQMQQYQMVAQEIVNAGGQPPPPQPPMKLPGVRDFYDHETHIQAHNRYRKSDEYDELPPELQAIIDMHVSEHEQALMAPQIAEQQQQMAMQQEQQQEAEKNRAYEQEGKAQDHHMNMEREALKGQVALQQAALKQGIR